MSGASPSGRAAGLRPQPPAAASQSSIPDAEAAALVEVVANALGTSLRHYMESTKARAIEAAAEWLNGPRVGECICSKCGIRHGGTNADGGF